MGFNLIDEKIFFMAQLPPPHHGASIVNNYIYKNNKIKDKFKIKFLNISPANKMNEVGKVSIKKVLKTLSIFIESIKHRFYLNQI